MRDNVIFYNVEESKGENCRLVIEKLLTEEMNMPGQHIYSTGNITGEVRIDVPHRIGKLGRNSRPIVAKFVKRQGKEYVMKHTKNLRGKKYSVNEQMPSKMKECRLAHTLKQLRQNHPNKKTHNIHFMKDKLMINNQEVTPAFERNPLPMAKVFP